MGFNSFKPLKFLKLWIKLAEDQGSKTPAWTEEVVLPVLCLAETLLATDGCLGSESFL